MRWDELSEEACPIARGCSVIGDRWTLLILRDALRGARRFERFQESLGITRHVLADRLRKLEDAGVFSRRKYQDRPERWEYLLTDRGRELQPVLMMLVAWADRHLPREEGPPLRYVWSDTGEMVEPALTDARTGRRIGPGEVRAVSRED
jgi:DNA-binding HxlR family transcriptional regulator